MGNQHLHSCVRKGSLIDGRKDSPNAELLLICFHRREVTYKKHPLRHEMMGTVWNIFLCPLHVAHQIFGALTDDETVASNNIIQHF